MTVRDHGVGVAPSQSEQVFRRFWRADASRNRIVGGSGLGLAISLEDARLHHGWLQAWGRPGRGAQFRLTLPRTQRVVSTTRRCRWYPPIATRTGGSVRRCEGDHGRRRE